jgi:hypothetical protein
MAGRRPSNGSAPRNGMSNKTNAVKAIPKKGETAEEAIARVQKRHPGERVVDPPRERSVSATNRTEIPGRIQEVANPRIPTSVGYPVASGYTFNTDIIRDRFMIGKLQGIVWANSGEWYNATGGVLQTAGVQDTGVNLELSYLLDHMYTFVAKEYMAVNKRVLRDTVLDFSITSATSVSTFAMWLYYYAEAYMHLRGLLGCLNAGNFNLLTSRVSAAVNEQQTHFESVYRRLLLHAAPTMLQTWLDRMCGPKTLGVDEPVIFTGFTFGDEPTMDLTNSTNIKILIDYAGSVLDILDGITAGNDNGANGNHSPDFQRIANTFMLAYGPPHLPGKDISYSPMEVAMQIGQTFTAVDTTPAPHQQFTWPNVHPALAAAEQGVVPMLVPKGLSDEDELTQLFSLIRVAPYSNDTSAFVTVASQPSHVGAICNIIAAKEGSQFGFWAQDTVFAQGIAGVGGVVELNFQNAETEMSVWAAEARHHGTGYNTDARLFRDYDRVYTRTTWMQSNTAQALERMFIASVQGS